MMVVYAISPALGASTNVSGSYYVIKQLIAIGLSLVAFMITARCRCHVLAQRLQAAADVRGGGMTLMAIIMPVNPHYPAHRWVRLGQFIIPVGRVTEVRLAYLVGWFLGAAGQSSRGERRPIGR